MSQDRTTGTDPFAEQIPAYALGALDPEDAARLEAHLATCPTCPAELAAFQAVASALAFSVDPAPEPLGHQARFQQKLDAADAVAEPPGHRERFLSKLNAETARTGEEVPAPAPPPPASPPRPQPAPVARRPWWQALNPAAGWALLAGGLALLLLLTSLWALDAQQRATATVQQAQATATQVTLAAQQAQATMTQAAAALQQAQATATTAAATAAQRDTLASILASPNAQSVVLTGTVADQPVTARLVEDPASGKAVLITDPLPAAPPGQVYELWLIQGNTPVAINVFAPDAQGRGILFFDVPGSLSDYDVAAVTVEPRFVTQPTTAPVLVGEV